MERGNALGRWRDERAQIGYDYDGTGSFSNGVYAARFDPSADMSRSPRGLFW
jgi:hypothetical protein